MRSSVFISARFRTGSTLLWNAFRRVEKAEAFYEPLHEQLAQMLRSPPLPQPDHYHVQSYFDNYPPESELSKRHQSDFGVCRLHLEADDQHPRLRDCFTFLIEKVDADRIPILKCNRIDFRLPWIRANFPTASIIHLYRSAREQWISSVHDNQNLVENNLDADPFLITTWARDLCEQFPFLASPFIKHAYQRFYYLWKLSYLAGSRQADLSVSFEDILAAPRATLGRLLEAAGLEPRDWIDSCLEVVVRRPPCSWKEYRDERWFHELEEECEVTLTELGLNHQYGTRKLAEIVDGNRRYQELCEDHRVRRWVLHSAQMALVDLKNTLEEKEKVISHLRSAVVGTQAGLQSGAGADTCPAGPASEANSCDIEAAVDIKRLSLLLGLLVACLNHLFVYRLLCIVRRPPHTQSTMDRLNSFLRRWMVPRIGRLHHHVSIPLHIPSHYFRTKSPPDGAPKISIVTPSLNQAKYLERTARSVFAQNYPKLEYIIQDGGSTDGTERVLQRLRPLVHRIESCKDRGQAHAINLGFAHTTGEIMAWLNSDDLLLPGTLNYVANFFLENSDVDVVYSHRILIDDQGLEIGRWVLPRHDCRVLRWVDYAPQETLFWRRRIWERAGGYVDESFQFALDWELLLRFQSAKAKIVRVPRFLGVFRVHGAQKTQSNLRDTGWEEMNRLREQYQGRPVSPNEIKHHIGSYLTRSIIYDNIYRLGLLRY